MSIFGNTNTHHSSAKSVFGGQAPFGHFGNKQTVGVIAADQNVFKAHNGGGNDAFLSAGATKHTSSYAQSIFGQYRSQSGSNNSTPQSVFGTSAIPHKTPQSVFGSASTPAPTPQSVFGSASESTASSVFGSVSSTSKQRGSLFGKQPNLTPVTHSAFDQAGTLAALQPLSQSTSNGVVTTSQNMYESQQTSTKSLFGKNTTMSSVQPQQPTYSADNALSGSSAIRTLFGKKISSGFLGVRAAEHSSDSGKHYYSLDEHLTDRELASFMADVFSLGDVPMKLPPQKVCFA